VKNDKSNGILGPLISAIVLGGLIWRGCIYSRTGVYTTQYDLRSKVVSAQDIWEMDAALTNYYASKAWSKDLFQVERNPNDPQQIVVRLFESKKTSRTAELSQETDLVCDLLQLLLECDQRNWKSVVVQVDINELDVYGRSGRAKLLRYAWTRDELSKIVWDKFNRSDIYALGQPI
jgi:hypothetical protein